MQAEQQAEQQAAGSKPDSMREGRKGRSLLRTLRRPLLQGSLRTVCHPYTHRRACKRGILSV